MNAKTAKITASTTIGVVAKLILNAIFDSLYKSSATGKEEPVDVTF